MVEQALHGYDVQLSAVHFAATSLAMLNPDIQFDRMNLYVMPLGSEGSNLSLGSLDFSWGETKRRSNLPCPLIIREWRPGMPQGYPAAVPWARKRASPPHCRIWTLQL